MKNLKSIFVSMMVCLGLTSALVSCSEDNKEPTTPAAKSIAATYNGDMTCSVMGSEDIFEDMTFTVAATDDANVTVTIPSFGNPPMQLPQIDVPGVKVSGKDGSYELAATEFSGTTETGKAYSGTLQGDFANNTITIKFNLQYGAMPVPMICTFTAAKN